MIIRRQSRSFRCSSPVSSGASTYTYAGTFRNLDLAIEIPPSAVSAADPLNFLGILTPYERVAPTARAHGIRRGESPGHRAES